MIAIGITGLIIVLGIITIIIGKKRYNYDLVAFGWAISLIVTCIIIIVLFSCYPTKIKVDYDIAKYEELKIEVQQLSTIGGNNCELNLLAKGELFNKVREMNNYIDENRIKSKSPWIGMFYSEEIGNLPKIELK